MTEGPEGRKSWQSPSQPKTARLTDQRQRFCSRVFYSWMGSEHDPRISVRGGLKPNKLLFPSQRPAIVHYPFQLPFWFYRIKIIKIDVMQTFN